MGSRMGDEGPGCRILKITHTHDVKQRTQLDFLPITEGDPNDLNTIFTTLKECIRVSTGRITVESFDLPIWLKAEG